MNAIRGKYGMFDFTNKKLRNQGLELSYKGREISVKVYCSKFEYGLSFEVRDYHYQVLTEKACSTGITGSEFAADKGDTFQIANIFADN